LYSCALSKVNLSTPNFVFSSFFFQAGDGIRDVTVTGVQTCALPIYACKPGPPRFRDSSREADSIGMIAAGWYRRAAHPAKIQVRSEERRGGRECSARCSGSFVRELNVGCHVRANGSETGRVQCQVRV